MKIKKGGGGLFATFHPDVILKPYLMPKPLPLTHQSYTLVTRHQQ